MFWQELRPGAPQNAWIQSQTTCAVLVKDEDGKWQPKVVKQKIWVEGVCYELQEIYGMESAPAVPTGVSNRKEGHFCRGGVLISTETPEHLSYRVGCSDQEPERNSFDAA